MSWQKRIRQLAEQAREWWTALDTEQQYLTVMVAVTAAAAIVERVGCREGMSETIVHLRVEEPGK